MRNEARGERANVHHVGNRFGGNLGQFSENDTFALKGNVSGNDKHDNGAWLHRLVCNWRVLSLFGRLESDNQDWNDSVRVWNISATDC